jgi:hypothetical protein
MLWKEFATLKCEMFLEVSMNKLKMNGNREWMNTTTSRKNHANNPRSSNVIKKWKTTWKPPWRLSNEEITNVGKLYRKMWLHIQIIMGCGFIHILTFFLTFRIGPYTQLSNVFICMMLICNCTWPLCYTQIDIRFIRVLKMPHMYII